MDLITVGLFVNIAIAAGRDCRHRFRSALDRSAPLTILSPKPWSGNRSGAHITPLAFLPYMCARFFSDSQEDSQAGG
jgi:hypothetical protein